MEQNLVVYNDGELELTISVENETIWLSQKQLANLFDVTIPNINMHIRTIYKEEELLADRTIKKFLIVQKEGKREVKREVDHYNLDMVISVGYKVNSKKATLFRQWATSVLRSYIINGFVINSDKITNERFVSLEDNVSSLRNRLENIENKIVDNTYIPIQGIFYNGQIFDAYAFINDILKEAKSKVVLIDNYIDDSIFTLFSKYPNISFTIYTQNISKQLELDYIKYQKQYNNIELKINKNFHDRFIILDDKTLYHLGSSLKDLGKKVFAFSKLDMDIEIFLDKGF